MEYPTRLLPQLHYKRIDFDEKHQNCYLLRHTDSKNIKDEFGKLRSDCLAAQTDHLRDYSTNLLSYFTVEDAKIRLFKSENFPYFMQLWQGNNLDYTPQYVLDFERTEDRGAFFLRIGDLNDAIFSNFDDTLRSNPVCKVLHTPINANFWHCSIRWFLDGIDTLDMTKSDRRRILSVAKTFLIECAYFDLLKYDVVPNRDFIR